MFDSCDMVFPKINWDGLSYFAITTSQLTVIHLDAIGFSLRQHRTRDALHHIGI